MNYKKTNIKILALVATAVLITAVAGCGKNTVPASSDLKDVAESVSGSVGSGMPSSIPEIENTQGLHLSSVYTSSIINPDAANVEAEDIGSLEVTNQTQQYLNHAELVANMSDGTVLHFIIEDLPSGAKAEIFDTENQSINMNAVCDSVTVTEEIYSDQSNPLNTVLDIVNSDDYTVVITNNGDETLYNLNVVYHGQMEDAYFGGRSFQTTIDSLGVGESYTLTEENLYSGIGVVSVNQE